MGACEETPLTLSHLNGAAILPPPFNYAYVVRLQRTTNHLAQDFVFLLSFINRGDEAFCRIALRNFFKGLGV